MKDLLRKLLLNASVLAVCTFGFDSAYAQMAPGSLPPTADMPPAGLSGNMATLPGVTAGTAPETLRDNPCPEPKKALASTPDDLARIQEDITRFTLCVQRAQLLERLNELATANIETIDSALNLTVSSQMDGNAVPGIMPNIPMPQLPESISNMLEDDAGDFNDMPRQNSGGSSSSSSSASETMPPSAWRIRDIQGTGGKMVARLVNRDGVFLKISAGESLPDDGGKVTAVNRTGVIIGDNGQTQSLKWVE